MTLITIGCSSDSTIFLLNKAAAQVSNPVIARDPLEPDQADAIASFIVQIPFGPVPVLASDGKIHLVYAKC